MLSGGVYKVCYNKAGQLISGCNYWNDPNQHELYLSKNVYLPFLNNEIKHENSSKYKENFSNLSRLVLIGGPDDHVIQPWQSAQYSFWDEELNVVPYNQLGYYTDDLFGLRALDEQGKITFCTFPGVHHTHWPHNREVYEKCIRPYLGWEPSLTGVRRNKKKTDHKADIFQANQNREKETSVRENNK